MFSSAIRLPMAVFLLVALLPPGGAAAQGADLLTYAGASTISLSILYGGAAKEFEQKTGIHFDAIDTTSGSGRGMEKLVKGGVSLAGVGRELTPQERSQGLVEHLIGYDALAVWVNRDNPAGKLTRAQIKGILSGKIRNWKEVGGDDRAVFLILEPLTDGRASTDCMQKSLLDSVPFGPPDATMENHRDQIMEVSRNPGAICCGSQGLQSTLSPAIKEQIKMVAIDGLFPDAKGISSRTYPAVRPLNLVTVGPGAGKVKAFIDYILSPEGQTIVGRNFVPAVLPPPSGAKGGRQP
jgi:phosphate transport system substrate-binding protein